MPKPAASLAVDAARAPEGENQALGPHSGPSPHPQALATPTPGWGLLKIFPNPLSCIFCTDHQVCPAPQGHRMAFPPGAGGCHPSASLLGHPGRIQFQIDSWVLVS